MTVEMRGDSVMRKKRLTTFMRIALIKFGVLDITIRKRQQRIYIPCDSSGANKQL